MARVFITGSADGLGKLAAETLLAAGHEVVVHARSDARMPALGARGVVGDLAKVDETRALAAAVNAIGTMDAVIHNAGVYDVPEIMAVNVIAPYLLTALMARPKRLVYLSSGMHRGGSSARIGLGDGGSYSDSKLYVTAFAAAVARRWPDVVASSVDPGWVPTKMGGRNAPDPLHLGHETQEWLAVSDDAAARASGGHWHFGKRVDAHPAANDHAFQDALLRALEQATGVTLPGARA